MEIRISGEWEAAPCPRPTTTSRIKRPRIMSYADGFTSRRSSRQPGRGADYELKEIDPTILAPPGAFELACDFIKVIREESPHAAAILFGGDRWSCVTDVVVAVLEDAPIGMATISEVGEQHDGHPCIVGIYIKKQLRGNGYGKKLMSATAEVGKAKCIAPLRCDLITIDAKNLIEALPNEIKKSLEIRDFSSGLFFKM